MFRQYFFEQAITAFDKALEIEPLLSDALAYKSLSTIKKYQFAKAESLSNDRKAALMALNDFVVIPGYERDRICSDLKKTVDLEFKDAFSRKITVLINANYCQ